MKCEWVDLLLLLTTVVILFVTILSNAYYRLPFSRSPIGFSIAFCISLSISYSIAMVFVALTTILITICISIGSIIADISMVIAHANEQITRNMSIKCELKEFIELHLQCYRYWNAFFLHLSGFSLLFCIFVVVSSTLSDFCKCSRILLAYQCSIKYLYLAFKLLFFWWELKW